MNIKEEALGTRSPTSMGMKCLTNFGARIVSLVAPDREGRLHDGTGYDNIAEYSDYEHFEATSAQASTLYKPY